MLSSMLTNKFCVPFNIACWQDNEVLSKLFDNSLPRQFKLIPAAVINNSISQKNNKLTINKGSNHGVYRGQGVVNNAGLVGIVSDVSKNYATAISLLNLQTSISVKLKRTNDA